MNGHIKDTAPALV